MVGLTLCLSIILQPLPAGAEPWRLASEDLGILRRTLDALGDVQQPYPALVDPSDPAAGTVDASVELSSARLEDGTPVIVIDDDGAEDVTRYLLLEAEWQGWPAGTLLHGVGPTVAVVTRNADDPSGLRAQGMLAFLDLMVAPPAGLHPDGGGLREDPQRFLGVFTPSTAGDPVDAAVLNRWRGRLPDALMALWQRDGLARYVEDRLMLVQPDRYAAVLASWLPGSALEGVDTFHVYAVTAFGQLFVCGENTAVEIIIDPYSGQVVILASMLRASAADERNARLERFLTLLEVDELDVTDAHGQSVHARTRDRVGALAAQDVFFPGSAGKVAGWELDLIRVDAVAAWTSLARPDVR